MKTLKSIFLIAILSISFTATSLAKNYEVNISEATKAGKVQLRAGNYNLTVNGDRVTFRDLRGASLTTTVKIENGSVKFKTTNVNYAGDHIKSIQLGGSTLTVEFTE